jgi:hypothetical protein
VRFFGQLSDDVLLGESLLAYAVSVGAAESGPLNAEALACAERSGDLGIQVILHNNVGWGCPRDGGHPGRHSSCRSRQESLGQARQALGEQTQEAYTRGMTLRLDQAIDLALGGSLAGHVTGRSVPLTCPATTIHQWYENRRWGVPLSIRSWDGLGDRPPSQAGRAGWARASGPGSAADVVAGRRVGLGRFAAEEVFPAGLERCPVLIEVGGAARRAFQAPAPVAMSCPDR